MSLKIKSEINLESEPCVLVWDEELFVGSEDGSIKTFDINLSSKSSWQAHSVQPFALAIGNDNLYSASNDGGIKVWSRTGQKVADLQSAGADVEALRFFESQLYAGDEDGNIIVYEKNDIKARYSVLEEVKDLWFNAPYLFTVRDLYVTITEINPGNSKSQFMTRHTIEGRTPLQITNNKLLFISRTGTGLCLHDASIDTIFKKLDQVKVSDMIVTTLATRNCDIWTGGWDGFLRKWKIADDKLKIAGEINLGGCINSLAAADNSVFVAVAGRKLVHIM